MGRWHRSAHAVVVCLAAVVPMAAGIGPWRWAGASAVPASAWAAGTGGVSTPAGLGYRCVWPGPGFEDFFTFTSHGRQLSGGVIESNISPIGSVPFTGSVHHGHLVILPLSGLGAFQGVLADGQLQVTAAFGDGPNVTLSCNLESRATWMRDVPQLSGQAVGPRINTADLLAAYSLEMARLDLPARALHPATAARLVRRLRAEAVGLEWGGAMHRAFGADWFALAVSARPAVGARQLAVAVGRGGDVMVLAVRSADGRCFYQVANVGPAPSNGGIGGVPVTGPGGQEYASAFGIGHRSCSADPVTVAVTPVATGF